MFKPIYKNDEERKKARITSIKKYQKSKTTVYSFRFHNQYDKIKPLPLLQKPYGG